jgi:uncharacterized membrane protein
MKTRIGHLWDKLNSSLWFIPALMAAASAGLSIVTVNLDWSVKEKLIKNTGWIWAGGAEGAREILSTIAGSMITVAGVTFSITVVVLTLASSQFGPRLLRNFMRDSGNQVVLGTFISTFTYGLLVLRTIRSGDGPEFVPHISVTVGMALALASLGVLIYFIHHVSVSINPRSSSPGCPTSSSAGSTGCSRKASADRLPRTQLRMAGARSRPSSSEMPVPSPAPRRDTYRPSTPIA